jgi:acyl dehydratase
MPRYYEDLEPGQVFVTQGRTINKADVVVAFAAWSWDTNPVHTDADVAHAGRFR